MATCRPGGTGAPALEADRLALLRSVLRAGATVVDLEHRREATGSVADELGDDRVLLSWHGEPDEAPPPLMEARALVTEMAARAPAALKLALPAPDASEALELLLALREVVPSALPWAGLPLGRTGRGLRLLAGWRRPGDSRPLSDLLYAHGGHPLADGARLGQPGQEQLASLGLEERDEPSRRFGVVGWPLTHTWSPILHADLWRRRGVDAVLVPLPVRASRDARELVDRLDLSGVAVTMPHKSHPTWTELPASTGARVGGVVNTLVRGTEGLRVASFDGPAVRRALASRMSLSGARVVVLGAGGVARAIVPELVAAGARACVQARDPRSAEELAREHGVEAAPLDGGVLPTDVLVNATPLGSRGHEVLVPDHRTDWPVRQAVVELVSTPPRTGLVAWAEARGLHVVDGLEVLARQAADQQRLWASTEPSGVRAPLTDDEVITRLRALVSEADVFD